MRRPLCLICLAFVVMVSVLQIFIKIPSESFDDLEGKTIRITGQVSSKQIKNDKKVIYLKNIQWENSSPEFHQISKEIKQNMQVMCYLEADEFPYIGSTVMVEGDFQQFLPSTNPGEFDQKKYYQVLNMSFRINRGFIVDIDAEYDYHGELLYQIKEKLKQTVDNGLPEKEAGIINAIMLGEKNDLDQEVKNLYQRSGISHILAISGLHITLLGMGIYKCLRRCAQNIIFSSVASIFLMIEYGRMTGLGTSTARAIFMFTVHLIGQLIGRTYDLITAIALACVVLLCTQPFYINHSGFLLSFGAVMGIALVNPRVQKWYPFAWPKKLYLKKLVKSFLASASITVTTLPILLTSFYEYPSYSIFLNLLIIPLMTLLFMFGILGLATGMISQWLGHLVFLPCKFILVIYEKSALLVEQFPAARIITGKPEIWQILIYYLFLILTIWRMGDQEESDTDFFPKVNRRYLPLVLLFAGSIVLGATFGKELTVTMLDIGQGDAIVVQTAQGQTFLIDGGSSSKKNIGMYQMLPFLKYNGISSVDYLFISHMDSDHISGIVELMEKSLQGGIRLKNLVVSQYAIQDEAYYNVIQTAIKNKITVLGMKGGDCLEIGEVQLNCIYPYKGEVYENNNSSSMVLELISGQFSGLFMGDLEESKEGRVLEHLQNLKKKKGEYDLLKVSHHGSNNSSSSYFLEYIRPKLSIISCGKKNRYGHPGKDTMKRLQEVNSEIMITPNEGAIEIKIVKDGTQMHIKSYGR